MTGRKRGLAAAMLAVGAAAVLAPQAAWAQREISTGTKKIIQKNLSDYDLRWFHPGFFIAVNGSRFVPEYSAAYAANTQYRVLTKIRPGFNVGFIADIQIHEYLRLRFVPGVAFYTRDVRFSGKPPVLEGVPGLPKGDTTQQIGNTALEIPLLLKFVSKRRRNVRLYMVGGVKYAADVGNKKKDQLPGQLRTNASDLSIEYGVGADLFYPIFKFAPEIRFSHGLWNLNSGENTFFNQTLGRFRSHTVTLYFNFE